MSAAGPDTALVVGTLATMDDQTTEGTWWLTSRAVRAVDPTALATLTGWAADQRTGLDTLSSSAPTGTEQAVTASTDLVAAVAARGAALQAALGCVGGPATSGADDLGPLPAPCPSLPSAPGTATVEGVGSSTGGGPSGSPNAAGMALPPTAGVLAGTGSAATGGSAVSSAVTGSATSPTPSVSSPGVPGPSGGFPLPPTPLPPTPLPPTPLPTTGGTTTTAPPVIQLPLPVAPSSPPVCLGRLICLGP